MRVLSVPAALHLMPPLGLLRVPMYCSAGFPFDLHLSFWGLKSLCLSADGAMPWRADHQRRTLLYRYSSRGFSAHSGVEAPAGPAYREELSPLGQAILECANDHLLPAHLARLVQPQLCNDRASEPD